MPRRDGTPTKAEQQKASNLGWRSMAEYFDNVTPEDATTQVRVKVARPHMVPVNQFDEVTMVSWCRHDLGCDSPPPRGTWNRAEAAALCLLYRMVAAGLVTRDSRGWCHLPNTQPKAAA